MNRKVCTKCGIEKMVSEFNIRKDSKDGYRNECKQCSKLSHHLNYKSLDEDVKLNIQLISQEKIGILNPDLPLNDEEITEKARQLAVIKRKEARKQRAIERRENLLKAHPKVKWVEYTMGSHNLTGKELKQQLLEMAERTINCPVCHKKMIYYGGGQARWTSASLDRRNNDYNKGIENFWIICRLCNTTKLDRSMEEMDDWVLKWQKIRERNNQT